MKYDPLIVLFMIIGISLQWVIDCCTRFPVAVGISGRCHEPRVLTRQVLPKPIGDPNETDDGHSLSTQSIFYDPDINGSPSPP